MSARTERSRGQRRGVALLLAVVIATVVGVCTLALWRGATVATRTLTLESAAMRADALADSAVVRALADVASGGWRVLALPGEMRVSSAGATRVTQWRADIGRMAWSTLVVRGWGDVHSGARGISAHADLRRIIPLVAPLPLPNAALTGVLPWSIDPAATVEIPIAAGVELRCRSSVAVTSARHPFPVLVDSLRLPRIDPDTLRDSLTGAFRLTHGRITRPIRIVGMVAVDSELVVGADLRVTGVLVVRGSLHPAGGRLDVTGAVVTGDTGGLASGLGAGDRVRYDACAIRRAVEQVTSPGPTRTWTTLTVF